MSTGRMPADSVAVSPTIPNQGVGIVSGKPQRAMPTTQTTFISNANLVTSDQLAAIVNFGEKSRPSALRRS